MICFLFFLAWTFHKPPAPAWLLHTHEVLALYHDIHSMGHRHLSPVVHCEKRLLHSIHTIASQTPLACRGDISLPVTVHGRVDMRRSFSTFRRQRVRIVPELDEWVSDVLPFWRGEGFSVFRYIWKMSVSVHLRMLTGTASSCERCKLLRGFPVNSQISHDLIEVTWLWISLWTPVHLKH